MEKKKIRMYFVLLLGYTVLNTDAAVTITPHNALSDGISFEQGSEGVIVCTINPYLNYFTWKIDNLVAAECLPNCNVYLSAATYAFTFDTANGIFNITINPVNGTDDGKVFLCDDGSNPATFTARVKEKIDKTVTGRSWCQRWCTLTICLSVFGGCGLYAIQCVVVICRCRKNKNEGHEVETKLLEIEIELEGTRKEFREEEEKRDNEWHTFLATFNSKMIEDRLAELDIKREQEKKYNQELLKIERGLENRSVAEKEDNARHEALAMQNMLVISKKQLDQLNKRGKQGQDDRAEERYQAWMHEYYKNIRSILKDLETNKQWIQTFGKQELIRRKAEIQKGYTNKLERQPLTHEQKNDQLEQILDEIECEINKTIQRLPDVQLKWRTDLAELEKMEVKYRNMIQDEIIMKENATSAERNQPSYRHQQNKSSIKRREQEIHEKREEMRTKKQSRDEELKQIVDSKKKELETKIAEEEAKLKKLMKENRSKTNRLTIYSVKRKILLYERKSRDTTLILEIAELEENYGALPDDDFQGKKLLSSEYSPGKYNVVDLISKIEEKEEQYEQLIETEVQKENLNNEGETKNTREESSCLKCLLFIPCFGIIGLCKTAKQNKDGERR